MQYKTILTIVENKKDAELLLPIARDIAQEFNAHLICIRPSIKIHTPYILQSFITKDVIELIYEKDEIINEEIKKIFDAATSAQDFIAEYREETTKSSEKISMLERDAYRSDLVIASSRRWAFTTNINVDPIHKLIVESGRPCLVVPDGYKSKHIPQNILFAWRASAAASTAAHNAIGFMKRAKKTTLMTVNKKKTVTAESLTDGHEMAVMLDRHGANINIWHASLSKKTIADQIVSEARNAGHDLIVMGAGHHGSGYRMIYNDTAKSVIQTATVPVLVSS